MGGEVEETEVHPEEGEPKVADATKRESDDWPSDPGSDASDGDRDRRPGAHNNDGGAPSVSNATGDDAGREEGKDTDSDGPDRSRGGDSDSPRDSPTAPSKPRGRTAWEWFVFIVGILGQLLYDLVLLASPDTTRRQRRYGSLMDDSDGRSPRSRARGGARPAPAAVLGPRRRYNCYR